jgi:hypothetical protein
MLGLQLKAGLDGLGVIWLPKMMVETDIKKTEFCQSIRRL